MKLDLHQNTCLWIYLWCSIFPLPFSAVKLKRNLSLQNDPVRRFWRETVWIHWQIWSIVWCIFSWVAMEVLHGASFKRTFAIGHIFKRSFGEKGWICQLRDTLHAPRGLTIYSWVVKRGYLLQTLLSSSPAMYTLHQLYGFEFRLRMPPIELFSPWHQNFACIQAANIPPPLL